MDKAGIIRAIRESPLTDAELTDIIAVCTMVTMANTFIGAGMDMMAGHQVEVTVEEATDG